jgi:hypothetical protein
MVVCNLSINFNEERSNAHSVFGMITEDVRIVIEDVRIVIEDVRIVIEDVRIVMDEVRIVTDNFSEDFCDLRSN